MNNQVDISPIDINRIKSEILKVAIDRGYDHPFSDARLTMSDYRIHEGENRILFHSPEKLILYGLKELEKEGRIIRDIIPKNWLKRLIQRTNEYTYFHLSTPVEIAKQRMKNEI